MYSTPQVQYRLHIRMKRELRSIREEVRRSKATYQAVEYFQKHFPASFITTNLARDLHNVLQTVQPKVQL